MWTPEMRNGWKKSLIFLFLLLSLLYLLAPLVCPETELTFQSTNPLIISVVWWSEFLATVPEVWVSFPALSHFLRSSGSGTGPLILVSTIEELLERESSGSDLESREYGLGNPLR
jgi:hypothetical protein